LNFTKYCYLSSYVQGQGHTAMDINSKSGVCTDLYDRLCLLPLPDICGLDCESHSVTTVTVLLDQINWCYTKRDG